MCKDWEGSRTKSEYISSKKQEIENSGRTVNIIDYDFDKLEGIQEGIKVFDGLNIKEIIFTLAPLLEVATLRGCNNACKHCYAEAKPPIKESDEQISKIDWDDFKLLTEGIKELSKRLSCPTITTNTANYQTLFHDADCSKILIKDKDGITHNWNEMAKMMYDATGCPQVFDTSGWYLQDTYTQKRIENLIQEILNEPTLKYVKAFNISINPFQALYFKHVENLRTGNQEKADFFKEKDSERIANVLFTLSPLFKTGKLKLLVRAMDNDSKNADGYSEKDLRTNYMANYIPKLRKLYENDLNEEKKVIKNPKKIKDYINKYKIQLRKVDKDLVITNKLKDIYDSKDEQYQKTENKREKPLNELLKPNSCYTIIDANGDVYATNFYKTYKTDIKLNFKNKNKKTAPIAPNLKEAMFTQKEIDIFLDNLKKPSLLTFLNI